MKTIGTNQVSAEVARVLERNVPVPHCVLAQLRQVLLAPFALPVVLLFESGLLELEDGVVDIESDLLIAFF